MYRGHVCAAAMCTIRDLQRNFVVGRIVMPIAIARDVAASAMRALLMREKLDQKSCFAASCAAKLS
jgi:hypothetical protein